MNSLRPLITISILGIICLLLYMKINETEPVIPAEVAEWDMSADLGNLDIGGPVNSMGADFGNVEMDAPINESAAAGPEFSAAPTFESAPDFSAEPNTAPASVSQGSVPFASTPAGTSPAAQDTATPYADVAETKKTDSSNLPPLPALPVVAAGAAAVAQEAINSGEANPTTELDTSAPTTPTTTQDSTSEPAPNYSSFETQPPTTPTDPIEADTKTTVDQASLFSATRLAVQSALDRGELSQALLLLSDWYGDPSLSAAEADEVQSLLSQLAGSVIYSTEHRLEPPYMVQAGERLEDVAQKYNVPWQLLAKVNGLSSPYQLQAGQQLKVLRGPFSARIDLGARKLVLMLDRRYAGQFSVDVEPTTSIEEGYWAVNQKLLTPANVGVVNSAASTSSEERSILLTSTTGGTNQVTILRAATPSATDPAGRVIQLKTGDVQDVYDILSLGSQVMIRR